MMMMMMILLDLAKSMEMLSSKLSIFPAKKNILSRRLCHFAALNSRETAKPKPSNQFRKTTQMIIFRNPRKTLKWGSWNPRRGDYPSQKKKSIIYLFIIIIRKHLNDHNLSTHHFPWGSFRKLPVPKSTFFVGAFVLFEDVIEMHLSEGKSC